MSLVGPDANGAEQSLRLRVRPLGDRTVIAELGHDGPDRRFLAASPDLPTSQRTIALARSLAISLGPLAIDIVPSYRSVLVEYDPGRSTFAAVEQVAHRSLAAAEWSEGSASRTVTIPVVYGDEYGPDLDDVAGHTGLTPDEVIAAHSRGLDYRVAFVGFSPGYAYLLGLPSGLAMPRLASPRAQVPAGSVAIGGQQTGIYPQATPGGWRLIGRTAIPLFDAGRSPAALLRPGDQIVFRSVGSDAYNEIAAQVRDGRYRPEVISSDGAGYERLAVPARRHAGPLLDVLEPGLLTTVQDRGRPGLGAQGISPGGAQDRAAALAANRLVGNPPDAALLEMTLAGPTLRPDRPVTLALTGADLGAMVGGEPVRHWARFVVPAGGILTFSAARAAGTGMRGYLAVSGGIDVPLMIGSRSTDLTAGFGGVAGRALVAGDRLPIGDGPVDSRLADFVVSPRPRPMGTEATLRVVVGPHDDLLSAEHLDRLLSQPWAVTSQSSHMGIRLAGPALRVAGAGDLVSEGIATGTVQVPADGQPIILLSGRGTVGGYAKVAGVIDADLDLCAQLRPGTTVRFRAVSLDEAVLTGRRYRDGLRWLEGSHDAALSGAVVRPSRIEAAAAGLLAIAERAVANTSLGVGTGAVSTVATASSLNGAAPVGSIGIGEGPSEAIMAIADEAAERIITAPLLGHFHRGARPGGQPLVRVGEGVAAGVLIGSITVLGASNDVIADEACEIVAFLVEDGDPVEYGQPVVRVRPLPGVQATGDA